MKEEFIAGCPILAESVGFGTISFRVFGPRDKCQGLT
jgi:hypothetical protein